MQWNVHCTQWQHQGWLPSFHTNIKFLSTNCRWFPHLHQRWHHWECLHLNTTLQVSWTKKCVGIQFFTSSFSSFPQLYVFTEDNALSSLTNANILQHWIKACILYTVLLQCSVSRLYTNWFTYCYTIFRIPLSSNGSPPPEHVFKKLVLPYRSWDLSWVFNFLLCLWLFGCSVFVSIWWWWQWVSFGPRWP